MNFFDQFSFLSFPDLGLVRFPAVHFSDAEKEAMGLRPTDTNHTILKHLAWTGYLARKQRGEFNDTTEEIVISRFKMEFETFDKTGVHDYLLLVYDINKWCDEQGIVRGWGRGSAASSLTLFCLGITNINPIRHNLNFPRFLSEARMKPVIKDGVIYVDGKTAPDIDVDYQFGRRAEVVKYLETKYAGRTCKISTRLELTGKTALKDALKIYGGYADDDAKRISDMVESRFGKVQGLHEARQENPDLAAWIEESDVHRDIFEVAMAIEGLAIARGMHPSGVFVSFDPLDGTIPIELSKARDGHADVVTSYDMETVVGLGVKCDLLGLRSADLVADTAKLVGIQLSDINVNDSSIYDFLAQNDKYSGLFQIEEGLTKEVVQKVRPCNIDQLAVCLAISRPGAMAGIPAYVEFVHKGTLKSICPEIDAVLKETGNVLIYQEQITAVCREVFGMTDITADSVRYAISKKKREEMAQWETILFKSGAERNIPEEAIRYFWNTCDASADYLFVKSHSYSYVYLTAATVYLKARYPQAFYLNMLKLAREEPNALEYMQSIIKEMGLAGFKVLPPDIFKSDSDFSIEGDAIRFGLSHMRGISESTIPKLSRFRRAFETKFEVFDAAKSEGVDIRVLCSLIYSGCLQWKGASRARLVLEAQTYNLLSDNQKKRVKQYALEYNEDIIEILRALPAKTNEKGKPVIPESQIQTIRRNHAPYWDMFQNNVKNEELTAYLMERHYLGFSYSSTLHRIFSSRIANIITIEQLKEQWDEFKKLPAPPKGTKVYTPSASIMAFMGETRRSVSQRTGEPFFKFHFADDTGSFLGMLYGEEKMTSCQAFNEKLPEEGDIVLLKGSLSKEGSMFFANSIIVQPNPVQTKTKKKD